jgi:hypothetical protein
MPYVGGRPAENQWFRWLPVICVAVAVVGFLIVRRVVVTPEEHRLAANEQRERELGARAERGDYYQRDMTDTEFLAKIGHPAPAGFQWVQVGDFRGDGPQDCGKVSLNNHWVACSYSGKVPAEAMDPAALARDPIWANRSFIVIADGLDVIVNPAQDGYDDVICDRKGNVSFEVLTTNDAWHLWVFELRPC